MKKLQKIFFDEISKEEALKIWKDKTDKREVFFLHDDLTESLIEDVSEIEDAQERIGVALSENQIHNRKLEAFTEMYKKLEEAKAHLIKCPGIEDLITDVMEAISYIEALGF